MTAYKIKFYFKDGSTKEFLFKCESQEDAISGLYKLNANDDIVSRTYGLELYIRRRVGVLSRTDKTEVHQWGIIAFIDGFGENNYEKN
jgi:hypothetical protein